MNFTTQTVLCSEMSEWCLNCAFNGGKFGSHPQQAERLFCSPQEVN